jgi:hypothetical protein
MGIQVQVVLNPKRDLTELPLKTFYRYVLQDELVFDAAGRYLHCPPPTTCARLGPL